MTAADVYAAVALHPFVPFGDDKCRLFPMLRRAFESLDKALAPSIPSEVLEHRDAIYEHHLELPIRL